MGGCKSLIFKHLRGGAGPRAVTRSFSTSYGLSRLIFGMFDPAVFCDTSIVSDSIQMPFHVVLERIILNPFFQSMRESKVMRSLKFVFALLVLKLVFDSYHCDKEPSDNRPKDMSKDFCQEDFAESIEAEWHE